MKIVMIILCVCSLSASIFLISRFGIKKKESEKYVSFDN